MPTRTAVPAGLNYARLMKTVYLSLGANEGDRAGNIAKAIQELSTNGVGVARQSSLYETEPVNARGGWFLNCVVKVESEKMPRELMDMLLRIERSLGRDRNANAGGNAAGLKDARTIDLDILLYGSSVIRTPELEIPHPRMAERRFVLVPLAEISPGIRHPTLQRTIAELLADTQDRSVVRPYAAPNE